MMTRAEAVEELAAQQGNPLVDWVAAFIGAMPGDRVLEPDTLEDATAYHYTRRNAVTVWFTDPGRFAYYAKINGAEAAKGIVEQWDRKTIPADLAAAIAAIPDDDQ